MTVRRITEVSRSGLVFDVEDAGPAGGEPVVLLHGFPQRSTSWRLVAPLLHDAGYRTLAMDQRGYSPRARPRSRRAYRLEEMVDDAAALLDEIGQPAHVVGHDWGGAVGWRLAAERPDQLSTLTSVSTPHVDAFLKALAGRQALSSWYMGLFQLPLLPELLGRTSLMTAALRSSGMPQSDLERFRAEVVDDGAFPTALMWYRGAPFSDPRRRTGPIKVPTTLVWSDGDQAISRVAVDATEQYVDAAYRLVVLHGVSHWIPSEAPAQLAQAITDRLRGD